MTAGRLLALLLLLVGTAQAADFSFARVELAQADGQLVLDADIRYMLNDKAAEALENGVPLSFVTHIEIRDSDVWIWQPDLVDRRLRSTLRYHPLSGLYELRRLDSDQQQQFATRQAALRALGELRKVPLISLDRLQQGKSYKVRLDTYLDLEALPLTLRPLAHLTPAWHLESDPWEHRLTP